ncbi:hypothetical protein [Nonomuraea africana]|uniref:Uncharacterized protein n=1 Tax=Nonomuraea africana TaxID=46171 RepID=A0ABR9KDG0_9ACTN|nr:hypothetical protein [Nonomuraea africana]MBE1560039.1 hypothetical protein [Nonomuraea africana]
MTRARPRHTDVWTGEDGNGTTECQLLGDRAARYILVTFTQAQPFTLSHPEWAGISHERLRRLVGMDVDPERGEQYVPHPPEPVAEPRYRVYWTVRLPRPHPFRAPQCMPEGITWWRRIQRQLRPERRNRDCCWYHRGDWSRVCATAIRLIRQARDEGVAADDIADYVRQEAQAEGMHGWELQALAALVCPADGIELQVLAGARRNSYVNGQHKSQAMLDAGVRRTVIIDWITPASVTGG